MSIVSVHGPHTFGSKAIQETGPAIGVVDPANGLKWDFRLDMTTTRPDQDFSWAFPPDGTPTPQVLADPAVVTYAAAGAKTATLTVSNVSRTINNKALTSNVATLTTSATHGFKVGQSVVITGVDATFNGTYTIASTPSGTTFTYALVAANVGTTAATGTAASDPAQYPTAGAYPIIVNAIAGTGPLTGLMSIEGGTVPQGDNTVVYDEEAYGNFILADHELGEIQEFIRHYELTEDDWDALVDEESSGADRPEVLDWFNETRP